MSQIPEVQTGMHPLGQNTVNVWKPLPYLPRDGEMAQSIT